MSEMWVYCINNTCHSVMICHMTMNNVAYESRESALSVDVSYVLFQCLLPVSAMAKDTHFALKSVILTHVALEISLRNCEEYIVIFALITYADVFTLVLLTGSDVQAKEKVPHINSETCFHMDKHL